MSLTPPAHAKVVRLGVGPSDRPPPGFGPTAVAIGSFDGVHRAHQAVVSAAVAEAEKIAALPIALTFEPHPRTFFRPDDPVFRLTPASEKATLLGIAGAKGIVEVVFDASFSSLSADEFVERILAGHLSAKAVIVGEGFRFGADRRGDTDLLRSLGQKLGFVSVVVPSVADQGGRLISSGRVRDALREGEIAEANTVLGYRWFVRGTVVQGDQRGRLLGYPTANLELVEALDLRFGIYAVTAQWGDSKSARGVASFGVRPTFDVGDPLLEVHLFDFDGDLYGETVSVVFHAWLRPELKFESVEKLIEQMDLDSDRARAVLAAPTLGSALDRSLGHWPRQKARRHVAADPSIA